MGNSSLQNTNDNTNKNMTLNNDVSNKKMKISNNTKSNVEKPQKIGKNSNDIKIFEENLKKQHPHKLGQEPNNIKIFEENLKKQETKKNEKNITNKQNNITNIKMDDEIDFNNDLLNNIVVEPNEPNELYEYNEPYIMDEEDDIRAPIPSTSGILLDDGTDDFIEFKKSILADNTLEPDMKQILIQSRLDTIKKFEAKSKSNIEKAFRAGMVSILMVKLKSNEYCKINTIQKEQVLKQIDKWIDGIIKTIKLDSEILYEINGLIDEIKFVRTDFDDIKLKQIFEPKNPDDYICFIDTMETIKLQSIKEEQERINKKMEQKRLEEEAEKKRLEEEEEKNQIMIVRKELVNVLILNLNKLSLIDKETKELKEIVIIPINNYIGLITDYIEIPSNDILTEFVKFINSIRIVKDVKEKILNLIKNSSI